MAAEISINRAVTGEIGAMGPSFSPYATAKDG
jgi:hypothetical protein